VGRPANTGGQDPAGGARPGRSTLAAVRTGATLSATLGGLAAYIGLEQLGANAALAALVGLGFALLARVAMTSLAHEWLLARARHHAAHGATPEGPKARPPRPGRS
jgi:hypothetical protein